MTPPPTAVLVDVGNVLLTVDFVPALRRLVPPDAPDAHQRILSLLEKKDDLEAGRLDEDEYIAWASERLGFDGTADTFRQAWCSVFQPIPQMWHALENVRSRGLRLILFSNTNPIHAPWFMDHFPFISSFEGAVFSHLVGAMKPDPEIYLHAFEEFSLVPGQTLYVDDLPENIAGGQRHGLRCHQYDHRRHHLFESWLAEEFPA